MTRTRFALLAAGLLSAARCRGRRPMDLAARCSESQDVRPVPGRRRSRRLASILVPHSLVRGGVSTCRAASAACGRGARFAADLLPALARKGTALSVEFGAKAAARCGVKPLVGSLCAPDRRLGHRPDGLRRAGAPSMPYRPLRQIAESPAAAGGLPFVEIADYPDLAHAGCRRGLRHAAACRAAVAHRSPYDRLR